MEARDTSAAGAKRASGVRTRLQTKRVQEEENKRAAAMAGMGPVEYWNTNVRSKSDIFRFYQLYHPEYPEILATAIAERVSSIIDKNQRGEMLTEEEMGYIHRSKQDPGVWDPREDIKQHETIAKVQIAIKKLEELKYE